MSFPPPGVRKSLRKPLRKRSSPPPGLGTPLVSPNLDPLVSSAIEEFLKFTPPVNPTSATLPQPRPGSAANSLNALQPGMKPTPITARLTQPPSASASVNVNALRLSGQATPPAPPETATKQPPQARSVETVQRLYKDLSRAAVDLNVASDQLAKPIQAYEASLKKLNLGVSAWVDLSAGHQDEYWWDRSVGYTKFKDGWAIALRTREGDYRDPEGSSEELWRFSDAPRWMRIEAVNKLPDLLAALLKQAEETTRKVKAKIAQASEMAEALGKVADDIAALEER